MTSFQYRGFDAALVTPEEYDVSLQARTERVNTWCRQLGKKNVCLVSIHTNAYDDDRYQWRQGVCIFPREL